MTLPADNRDQMIQMIICTSHMHRNRWKDLEISEESQPMTTNLRNSLSGSANRIIVKPFNCIPLQELCSGSTWWPQASCFCSWVTRIFFNANNDLLIRDTREVKHHIYFKRQTQMYQVTKLPIKFYLSFTLHYFYK